MNVTNYTHYYIAQEDVMTMREGGIFQYDGDRSIVGNGTLEFTATGGWFLRFEGPVGECPHLFIMTVHAVN